MIYSQWDINVLRLRKKLNPFSSSPSTIHSVPEIPANVSAQRRAADAIEIAEKKIYEFEQIYNITSDAQIRDQMYQKIESLRNEVKSNKNKIDKLNIIFTTFFFKFSPFWKFSMLKFVRPLNFFFIAKTIWNFLFFSL